MIHPTTTCYRSLLETAVRLRYIPHMAAATIFEDALALPVDDRIKLAGELLASVDEDSPHGKPPGQLNCKDEWPISVTTAAAHGLTFVNVSSPAYATSDAKVRSVPQPTAAQ
jgi:hypothetical protein